MPAGTAHRSGRYRGIVFKAEGIEMRYAASILAMIGLAAVLCAPVIIEAQNSRMQPVTLLDVPPANDQPMVVGAAGVRPLQLPN